MFNLFSIISSFNLAKQRHRYNWKTAGHHRKPSNQLILERCKVPDALYGTHKKHRIWAPFPKFRFQSGRIFASTDLHPVIETVNKRVCHVKEVVYCSEEEAARVCSSCRSRYANLLMLNYGRFQTEP